MISEGLMKKLSVTGLCDDSRKVKPGNLFFSIPTEGFEEFAKNAIAAGAVAVVGEVPSPFDIASKWIQVSNVKEARLEAAKIFYKDPFSKISCHAVTGTNGKTTSAFLMNAMLESANHKTALLGTIKNKIVNNSVQATLTTPGLLDLFQFAYKAVNAGCTDLVLEASSHSLIQGRVSGIRFKSALFSNLTQDHLDYHKTMDNYFEAKKLLFTKYLSDDGVSVVNIDDTYGEKLYEMILGKKIAVSRLGKDYALVKPFGNIKSNENGFEFLLPMIAQESFETPLCGDFNVDNVLLVLAWAKALGIPELSMRAALASVRVPGRFEKVWNKNGKHVIVDYAHTPDALERVLNTARSLCQGSLNCVFGCGGDRDKTKRSIMGQVAESIADKVYVTSDNPRTENPLEIIQDICSQMNSSKYEIIENRYAAIEKACLSLEKGDFLVIAGKGHEDYQIIGKTKYHFDDRETVLKVMEKC